MNLTIRRTLFACVLAVTFAAVGCQSPGGSAAGKRGSDRGTFDAGKTVPSDAMRVDQGAHAKLIHRAQRPELVWVKDATTDKVVYSGAAPTYSNVVVDPQADVIEVNDIQVRHSGKLDPDHRYQLYFKGR